MATRIFSLEFTREHDRIQVRSCEGFSGELMTVKKCDDTKISLEKTEEYSRKIKELLSNANREGTVGRNIINNLKQTGQLLYDEMLPTKTKESLNNTSANNLVLGIDDRLINIPWELLYDGQEFLCQRFNMGRVVSTRQNFSATQRNIDTPLKMLLLIDPQDNLPSSYMEGLKLRDMLDEKEDLAEVDLKSSNVTIDYLRGNLKLYDSIHYAGHADYNPENPADSGFLLHDGKLTAQNITGMIGRTPFPSFIFSNACQSGETDEWKVDKGYENVFGLANAFLLAGVRHYIGTFWEIQDKPSLHFALAFYEALMEGSTIGEAVRIARLVSMEEFGEESVVWASYMLYGDPTYTYVKRDTQVGLVESSAIEMEAEKSEDANIQLRGEEGSKPQKDKKTIYVAIAAVIVLGILLTFLFMKKNDKNISPVNKQSSPVITKADQNKNQQTVDRLVDSLVVQYQRDNLSSQEKLDELHINPEQVQILRNIQKNRIDRAEKDFILGRMIEDIKNNRQLSTMDRQIMNKLMGVFGLAESNGTDHLTAEKLGEVLAARVTDVDANLTQEAGKPVGTTPVDLNDEAKGVGAEGSSDALIEVLGELAK